MEIEGETFEMVLCIETFHCLASPELMVEGVKQFIDEQSGMFVIADIFYKKDIKKLEKMFKKHFNIDKKEILTCNVKHAMTLD